MKDKSNKIDLAGAGCPMPILSHDTIQLSHGAGGKLSHDLIAKLFLPYFGNDKLDALNDQAELSIGNSRLSFSTDSFVVDPIFFPGGDIGELAVNGTVNDISMNGARPLCLSVGFIIEEGFEMAALGRIVESMARAAEAAGVEIVTGDTKVVNRGKGDKIYINTSGIGLIEHNYILGADQLKPGDKIIISGSVADHGICILSQREGLSFETEIESDTAALHNLVAAILDAGGGEVRALRDPTRGGVAATLNEFAESSDVGILLQENAVPVKPAVRSASELLGIDPLHVANEGKLIAIVGAARADSVLAKMKNDSLGTDSAIIGEVTSDRPGTVVAETMMGVLRIVDLPVGEQLPRIC